MQFSWMKFISQQCSNVNRGESADAPKPKRSKVEIKGKHQYVDDVNSIIVDDEISLECLLNYQKPYQAQKCWMS